MFTATHRIEIGKPNGKGGMDRETIFVEKKGLELKTSESSHGREVSPWSLTEQGGLLYEGKPATWLVGSGGMAKLFRANLGIKRVVVVQ